MSDCCDQNAPPTGCRQGRDCPVHAAKATALVKRTCEAIGICQHTERECDGACEKVPALPAAEGVVELYQWPGYRPCYWTTVTAIALASLLISGSTAWYLYGRFSTVFWAWANLNF